MIQINAINTNTTSKTATLSGNFNDLYDLLAAPSLIIITKE